MAPRPRLVVNADDFGLVSEVNRAVRDAHDAGTVTSATLMMTGEAVAEAVDFARAAPALGVGLHFTLTHGRPLSGHPYSLVDATGDFVTRRELVRRSLRGRVRGTEVEAELVAQLDRMVALGIEPTHIDGHQHIQVLPGISSRVASVAQSRGLMVRVPTVNWRFAATRSAQRLSLEVLCRLAPRAGLRPSTHAFVSIFDDRPPREIGPDSYVNLIHRAGAATIELMVHPSYPSARLAAIHPKLYALALSEGRALVDPRTAEALRQIADLVTYRDLIADP